MPLKDHKLFLAGLHQQKGFKDWVDDVEKHRPKIRSFDPADQVHCLETWAYDSGRLEGYKLALSHLGVKLDE